MKTQTKLEKQMDVRAKISGFAKGEQDAYNFLSRMWFGPDSGWGTRNHLANRMLKAYHLDGVATALCVFSIWQEAFEAGLIKESTI